jgi:CheY-like chemotaxis protein
MAKILLIEDDELMLRMYQRVLSIEGFAVEMAVDGQAGYDKAKVFQPDLILLDVMMPVMNGLQTLEKLKQDPETKNFPVFMLTNLANKPDADFALKKGALKYLIKSDYDAKEVVVAIKEFLNKPNPA